MEEKRVVFELITYKYNVSIEVNETLSAAKFLFHFYEGQLQRRTVPASLRYDQLYLEIMKVVEDFGNDISINGGTASFSTTYVGEESSMMEITMRPLRYDDSFFDYLLEFFEDIFLVFIQKPAPNGSVVNF